MRVIKCVMHLHISGRLKCSPKIYTSGRWSESGTPKFMINLSRHVTAQSDPCVFVTCDGDGEDVEIDVDIDSAVCTDSTLRFDMLPLTKNAEGAPCRCKSGSFTVNLHELQAHIGESVHGKLVELSDPHLDRGTMEFIVKTADYPVQFDASNASISTHHGKEMVLSGLQVFWDVPPDDGLGELKRIHTPSYYAFPGGVYGMTYPHVSSDEKVLLNLAKVAIERVDRDVSVSETSIVAAVAAQRRTEEMCEGIYEAALVFGETCKAVATAYLYMTDHMSTKTSWPFTPAMDQMGEQFGQSRSTEADDCEGLGHEIEMVAKEIANGSGRMDSDGQEWTSPLMKALSFIARNYVTCMTTWGVSAAALSGRPEDADHMTCHIAAMAFPNTRFKDMLDSGRRLKRTSIVSKFQRPTPEYSREWPVLMLEGTGQLCSDLRYDTPNYARSMEARGRMSSHIKLGSACVPKIYSDVKNPDMVSFYKALVSAFVPPGTIEGVIDVWFGPPTKAAYGVRMRDVISGNMIVAPCLKMDPNAYAMCINYAKSTSVPPSLKPCDGSVTESLQALLDEFHDGAPRARTDTRCEYFVRSEWFRSMLPQFKNARAHVVGMRATAEPLVRGITVVHIDMWFK